MKMAASNSFKWRVLNCGRFALFPPPLAQPILSSTFVFAQIASYTAAIEADGRNHVLFSNRSAAHFRCDLTSLAGRFAHAHDSLPPPPPSRPELPLLAMASP